MVYPASYGTERVETEEDDALDRSSNTIDDEDQGFIVGGRRLLKPARITGGSVVSRNEFMTGSVDAGLTSLLM